MSEILSQIQDLIARGEVRLSDHGYDELAADGLFVRDILNGAKDALIVEEYPNYHKGPCVLALQMDPQRHPVHVVWGIPQGTSSPAVLVTAYRPNPNLWSSDFLRRRA